MRQTPLLLDCTLRDGGYYTRWDFDNELVDLYLHTMSRIGVDYVELGYRSPEQKEYQGEYFYLSSARLQQAKKILGDKTRLAIMLNAKDCKTDGIKPLLESAQGIVTLVRVACDPNGLVHGLAICKAIREMGFEVGLNLMYLSRNIGNDALIRSLKENTNSFDYLYLVDSFGGCFPGQVQGEFKKYFESFPGKLGFHSHDNIQLAFANTLAALEGGASIIDSTVTGMGRGAGNLATELFVSYLASRTPTEAHGDLSVLSPLLERFKELKREYEWGTDLPYMISGFNDLPQKDVMDWLGRRRFNASSIVRALNGGSKTTSENPLRPLDTSVAKPANTGALVIGGGESVANHLEGILSYAENKKLSVVFSSTKHLSLLKKLIPGSWVCLPGSESDKLLRNSVSLKEIESAQFVFSTPPRLFEVSKSGFFAPAYQVDPIEPPSKGGHKRTLLERETPLGLALAVTRALKSQEVFLVGFDGYSNQDTVSRELNIESMEIIDHFQETNPNLRMESLTPTIFPVKARSLYFGLQN